MTRFGVMKHLRLLEEAGLVVTRSAGPREAPLPQPRPDQARPRPVGEQVRRALGGRARRPQAETGARRWRRCTRSTSARPPSASGRRSPTPRSGASTRFGALLDSEMTPGSRYEMSAGEGTMPLGEGENLEVDPPRRLVQSMTALWSDEVKSEGDLADHLGDRAGRRRLVPPHRHPRPAPRGRARRALRRLADDPLRPQDVARDRRAADDARIAALRLRVTPTGLEPLGRETSARDPGAQSARQPIVPGDDAMG